MIKFKGWIPAFSTVILLTIFQSNLTGQSQWSTDSAVNNLVAIQLNTDLSSPVITKDGSKGVFIVWVKDPLANSSISAMRIGESGANLWPQGGNSLAGNGITPSAPTIVAGDNGDFYAAWLDNRNSAFENEVFTQRFNSDAAAYWTTDMLVHKLNNFPPAILKNVSSGVITTSYFKATFDHHISFNFVDDAGNVSFSPQGIVSNITKGEQPFDAPAPELAAALGGGFVATWVDARFDTVIFAKGIRGDGSVWSPGEVMVDSTITQNSIPVVVSDGNEGVIIVWLEPFPGGQADLIKATRLDSSGTAVWEKRVINSTPGQKRHLKIISDEQNGAYLVWQLQINAKIYAQRMTTDGMSWGSDQIVADADGSHTNADIATTGQGSLVVVWEDNRGNDIDIFAQMFDANGDRAAGWNAAGVAVSTALNAQLRPKVAADGLGGLIATWEDTRGGLVTDIYAQRVSVTSELGEFRNIQVTSPTQDTVWEAGSSQIIMWTASPELDNLLLEMVCVVDTGTVIKTIGTVQNSNPQNGSFEYTAPNIISDSCKIRIRAVAPNFIVAESATFEIVAGAGPVTQNVTAPDSSLFGQPIQVTANVTDLTGVGQVFLSFATSGGVFNSMPMAAVDVDQYSAEIPGAEVTERGVSYRVIAFDDIGNSDTTATSFITVSFAGGVQTTQILGNTSQTAYRMISSPNLLDDPQIFARLQASQFGAVDTTSWRLFHYRDGGYTELDSTTLTDTTFAFNPGSAYWLISSSTRMIDFGSGTSLRADTNYTVTLTNGWNQISTPFAFPVSWQAISIEPDTLQTPYLYEGVFDTTGFLEPYKGYFVFNPLDAVQLTIPPVAAENSSSILARTMPGGFNWAIQIKASCNEARDTFNYLGIHERARDQWDRLDYVEPPPIGEYVSVYFPRQDWPVFPNNYTTDYREAMGEGQTWVFEVETNIRNSQTRISFEGVESLPDDLEAILLDEKLNVTQNIRRENTYVFPTGKSGTIKTLKLVIGKNDYLASEIAGLDLIPTDFELAQNFPNPFNPSTTIRYGLPRAEKVTVRVFDLLGREIITLIDGDEKEAGYHVINWHGRDRSGAPVASGLYFYQIRSGDFSKTRKMVLVK